MAGYIIVLSKKAEKQLDKLDDNTTKPLLEALRIIERSPSTRLPKIKR